MLGFVDRTQGEFRLVAREGRMPSARAWAYPRQQRNPETDQLSLSIDKARQPKVRYIF